MKTWIKRIAAVLAAVLVIVIAVAGIFLLTFDPNAYKPRLQALVQERYHRTLGIDGDIEMSLLPRVALTLPGVSLSEPGSDEVFASFENARMDLAIWPLLQRHVVVDRVSLEGARARVLRDAQGNFNFDNLLGGAAASANDATPGTSSDASHESDAPMRIDIAAVDVQDGEVYYQDAATGAALTLGDFNLKTRGVTLGKPFDVTLSGHVRGAARTGGGVVDAQVNADGAVTLEPEQGRYGVQRLQARLNGAFAEVQARSLTLRGAASFDRRAERVQANGVEIVFQGDMPHPQRPLAGVEATLTVARLAADTAAQGFEADKLAVRAKGTRQGAPFQLALDAPAVKASAAAAAAEPITGRVRLDGADALDANFSLSGISGTANALQVAELKAAGNFKQGARAVQFSLVSPAQLDVASRAFALTAVKADASVTDPALPHGAVAIAAAGTMSADLSKDVARTQLAGTVDGAQVNVTAQATGITTVPAIHLMFNTANLAVAKVLPARVPLTGTAGAEADLRATGSSSAELKQSLSGIMHVSIRDGALHGIDIAQTLRELKAAFKSLRGDAKGEASAPVQADAARRTPFTTLEANLNFAQGVGTVQRLEVVSPVLRITQGDPARIDVGQDAVDLVAKVQVADAAAQADLADLRGVTVPVRVSGSFDHLAYHVDWRAVATDAVTRTLRRTLRDAVSGDKQDKPRDALRDLDKIFKGITGK